MDKIYILFRSRNELLQFNHLLHSYGIDSVTTSSPSCILAPCSLSIMLPNSNSTNTAIDILSRRHYSGFSGVYSVRQIDAYGRCTGKRIH